MLRIAKFTCLLSLVMVGSLKIYINYLIKSLIICQNTGQTDLPAKFGEGSSVGTS